MKRNWQYTTFEVESSLGEVWMIIMSLNNHDNDDAGGVMRMIMTMMMKMMMIMVMMMMVMMQVG